MTTNHDYKFVSDQTAQQCLDIARHYRDLALSQVPELKFVTDFDKPFTDLSRLVSGEIQTTASLDTGLIEATAKFLFFAANQGCFSSIKPEIKDNLQDLYASLRSFCVTLGKNMPDKTLFPEAKSTQTQGVDIVYEPAQIHI